MYHNDSIKIEPPSTINEHDPDFTLHDRQNSNIHGDSESAPRSKNLQTYKSWVDKCSMNCSTDKCQYKTKDIIDFKLHIISEHGYVFEDYCDEKGLEPGSPWSEIASLQCKLCKKSVRNNYFDVEKHMKESHPGQSQLKKW